MKSNKITDSHGTVIDVATEVINLIHNLPEVTKISLGEIRHISGGRRDIKFLPINGGIKVVVRGNGAVQQMYVYTKETNKVTGVIENGFERSV